MIGSFGAPSFLYENPISKSIIDRAQTGFLSKQNCTLIVLELWNKEFLPYSQHKGIWIAGLTFYQFNHPSFRNINLETLIVGPKKPSRYKGRYVRVYKDKGYARFPEITKGFELSELKQLGIIK